ncbi:MAG TPA: hypothetical protein VFW77_04525 [Candidatus Saccharimonadales bacterium]|nr:hypothetical protein [Candidatus Saccharimonadales bacterium]
MSLKKTIAIDLDDVLAAGAQGFVDYSNKRWGTNLTIADYTERWAQMWQVDIHEERRRARDIYNSGVVRKFKIMDKAMPVLTRLSKNYKLVVLTSRVRSIEKDTRDWLEEHFKGLFADIHFSGFYDELTHYSHTYTKDEISKEIGANYLIDDQLKHCVAAANAGVTSLLFGDYSWNKAENLPPGVIKAKNWKEVEGYFAKRG